MPDLNKRQKPRFTSMQKINLLIIIAISFNVIMSFTGLKYLNATNYASKYGQNLDQLDFDCDGSLAQPSRYSRGTQQLRFATLKCPWGAGTSRNYSENLVKWYNISSLDKDVFRRCSNLELPLQISGPNECFPRIIMLASHPTSGNRLFRDLLDGVVDGLDLSMTMYPETGVDAERRKRLKEKGKAEISREKTRKNKNLLFNLPLFEEKTIARRKMEFFSNSTKGSAITKRRRGMTKAEISSHERDHGNKEQIEKEEEKTRANLENLQIFGSIKTVTAIPFMKLPVIFKSHLCTGCSAEEQNEFLNYFKHIHQGDKLHGVIRMARNPEQILRDKHRWSAGKDCKNVTKVKEDCFARFAEKYCGNLIEFSVGYTQFHSFWNSLDQRIPQIIVHYEHLTSKEYVQEEMRSVLKLLDDVTPEIDFMQFDQLETIDRVKNEVIVETKYNHGSLVADVCGKDVARKLHEATKSVSEPLGYVFDAESGTWSLPK